MSTVLIPEVVIFIDSATLSNQLIELIACGVGKQQTKSTENPALRIKQSGEQCQCPRSGNSNKRHDEYGST